MDRDDESSETFSSDSEEEEQICVPTSPERDEEDDGADEDLVTQSFGNVLRYSKAFPRETIAEFLAACGFLFFFFSVCFYGLRLLVVIRPRCTH